MFLKDHIWMALVGLIGAVHGINHYIETSHLDLMSIVFVVLSVLYFVAIATKKEDV